MKKTIIEETKRILEIMSTMDKSILLTELNVKYLDKLLDKINKSGVESLTDSEKIDLSKMSRGENVNEPEKHSLGLKPETLRFTVVGMFHTTPGEYGELFGTKKYKRSFITGEAKEIAGNDIPVFLDGDISQLDKPKEQQDIRMITSKGEYECTATVGTLKSSIYSNKFDPDEPCYFLDLLKDDKEAELDEGNAFIGAMNKAKEGGKDTFEVNGKTYNVK